MECIMCSYLLNLRRSLKPSIHLIKKFILLYRETERFLTKLLDSIRSLSCLETSPEMITGALRQLRGLREYNNIEMKKNGKRLYKR